MIGRGLHDNYMTPYVRVPGTNIVLPTGAPSSNTTLEGYSPEELHRHTKWQKGS